MNQTPELSPQQETTIVRTYLAVLRMVREGEIKPVRQAVQRLEAIETRLQAGVPDPIEELKLMQERTDINTIVQAFEIERQFVQVARSYSERNGITYGTWREMGVDAPTLTAAGVGQKGVQLALPMGAPKKERTSQGSGRRGGAVNVVWRTDTVWPYFEQGLQRGPILRQDGEPSVLEKALAFFTDAPEPMSEKNVMNYVKRFEDMGRLKVVRGPGINSRNQPMPNLILSVSLPTATPAPATAPAPRTKRPGRSRAA